MDTTLTRMDATFRRTMTSVTDLLFPVNKGKDELRQQIIRKSKAKIAVVCKLYSNLLHFTPKLVNFLTLCKSLHDNLTTD